MTCFIKNGLCKSLDKTFVIGTRGKPTNEETLGNLEVRPRLFWTVKNDRPTFKDFFSLINQVTDEDDINIIANTDIYFDDESIWLIKKWLQKDECFALSRWDIYFDGKPQHFNRRDTADVWIFKGKIKDIPDCDFTLGIPGCDNAICERIQRAG